MKKLFLIICCVLGFCACAMDESETTGSIYGLVTAEETAEPIRATGVELYYYGSLLLKTVTYDDGHYEFENLTAGEYDLKVSASGYTDVLYYVIVEAGRTARADMQMKKIETGVTVLTLTPTISSSKVSFKGEFRYQYSADWPTEYGFAYSMSPDPTINNGHIVKGTMTTERGYFFVAEPTDLNSGTTYYVRAYAKNKKGISYGENRMFNTY